MGHGNGGGRPGVSAVILAHRRKGELERVLERLDELPVDEVLVVENGPGGELDDVVAGHARVRLLQPGENLGIAGRNLAAREARHEYLPLLDDDSYPHPGAIETMLRAFESSPRLAVVGGLVRDIDGDGRIVRQDEAGTFDWFLRGGRTDEPPVEGFPAFFFPEGACMARREAFVEAKGFFEPYFFCGVEVDLTTRLIGLGWEVTYQPHAVFDHMKADSGRTGAARMLHLRVRNHLWYLWLLFPPALAARRMAAYLLFDLVESLYRRAGRSWLSGIAEAWRRREDVRWARHPLPRSTLRRAELNRGRLHVRLLWAQLRRRLPLVSRD
jgi:GT2 family glycosyltransferase